MFISLSVQRSTNAVSVETAHHFWVLCPEGTFAFYIFDLKGRFEFGGLNTIGYRCFDDSAWIDADGRHIDFRTNNNGRLRRDSIFAIEKGRLVRKDFLQNGAPPAASQWSGLDSGASLFTVVGT